MKKAREDVVCKALCHKARVLDMTQEDMARAAGVTTVTLRTRLYGEKSFTLDEAYGIARAMGIAPAEFEQYFPDRRRLACKGR